MASVQLEAPLANDVAPDETNVAAPEIESDSNWDPYTPDTAYTEDDWVYPHPTDFKLTDAPIDEWRKLKVAVIGAGLTGITAGILLPAKVPGIDLTILEKNADVVRLYW